MKINRIQKIRELLEDNHSISINTLCDTFNVSKYTIRRDINELEKTGFLKKVYGGIVLQEQEHNSPEPFSLRESRNVQAKKKIAHIAASQVQDGDIIYIDVYHERLVYEVYDIFYVIKNGYISFSLDNDLLYLITCSLVYQNQQLVIVSRLIV